MRRAELEKELAELHEASMGWALSCCGWDRDEAEEVLSMSYVKMLDGRARHEGRASLKTFFFGVVRRTAAEQRRRRRLRDLLLLRLGAYRQGEATDSPAAESLAARSGEAALLRRALRALPARQREILTLVFYHDLTVDQAAGVMGVAVGTARAHYERAKARLRTSLGAAAEMDP